MEPLTPGERALVFRRALSLLSSGHAGTDINAIALHIYQDVRGSAPFFDVITTVQQAQRTINAGQNAAAGNNPIGTPQPPIDQSIIQPATYQFLARVIVTAHRPDGTSVNTVVLVPFTGALTPAQIQAMAVAAVTNAQNANLPPPVFGQAIPTATFSSELYTIGRNREF